MSSPPSLGVTEFRVNEIQKLWFATQRQEWTSLAIVPATPGFSVVPLAKALARAGETYLERGVRLILGEGTDLNSASRIIIEMSNQVSHSNCVIIALDSIIQNAAGIPVILAADACLLGIQLGKSSFEQTNRTVEMIGLSRFVGAVTFAPLSKPFFSFKWPGAFKKEAAPKVLAASAQTASKPPFLPPPKPK